MKKPLFFHSLILLFFLAHSLSASKEESVSIPFVKKTVIDGNPSEWDKGIPRFPLFGDYLDEPALSPLDQASFSLAWNGKGILVSVYLSDDSYRESMKTDRFWAFDSVEIFLSRGQGDTERIQFIISPGMTQDQPECRWYPYDYRTDPKLKSVKPVPILARKKTDANQCVLEILIPFQALGIVPKKGKELAFQIYVNDLDGREKRRSIWYHVPDANKDAHAFRRIVLTEQTVEPVFSGIIKSYLLDDEQVIVKALSVSNDVKKGLLLTGENNLWSHSLEWKKHPAYWEAKLELPRDLFTKATLSVDGRNFANLSLEKLPKKYVTKKTLPFENEIRAYEEQDRRSPPQKGGILFVGSSSIRMWKSLVQDMNPLPVLNRGFGGSQASDVLNFLERIVFKYEPSKIVYYEGDNDISSGKTAEEFRDDVAVFVRKTLEKLPETEIYLLTVKLSPSREEFWPEYRKANQLLQKLAETDKRLHTIDIVTPMQDATGKVREELFLQDKLHLNTQGYAIWTETVKKALQPK